MRIEALLAAGVFASLVGACKGSTNNLAPIEDAPDNGNGDGGGNGRVDARPVPDATPAPYCTAKRGTNLKLTQIATDLRLPVYVTAPAGDSRIFVVENEGRVRVIKDGSLLAEPFFDIDSIQGLPTGDRLRTNSEEAGLLGLAFHPAYATNGRVFIYYATAGNDVLVAEYGAEPGSDVARTTAGRAVLRVAHRNGNHFGGTIQFGTDGFLYVSIGDNAAPEDRSDGRNTETLLGKLLRIDVNSGDPYGIPADNPYATSGGAKEIFAWGLRNPYRFHIDHETNNIFIGDVGHAVWEEIDVIPAGDRGLNFGWPKCEGAHVYNGGSNSDTGACQVSGAIGPVHEYDQRDSTDPDNPCAVIGGAVYRGTCMPDMVGQYFFADKCTAKIHSFLYEEGRAPQVVNRSDDLDSERILYQNLSGFGVDGFGELYVTSLGIPPLTTPGRVYRVEVE